MIRRFSLFATAFVIAGCSPKPPPATQDVSKPSETSNVAQRPISKSAEELPPPDAREAALSKAVLEILEEAHLLGKKIDDDVSKTAFATYLERLDNGKVFLLASDRQELQKYADKIDDELRSGRLDLAHEGAKIFVTRVEAVDKMIQAILAAPMDFSNEEYIELDPKKLAVATTDPELRERWRQRLELEVMERVAGMEERLAADKKAAEKKAAVKLKKKPPPAAGSGSGSGAADDEDLDADHSPLTQIPATAELREAKARADLAKAYSGRFARLRNPDKLDAASDLINALTSALDPHTDYLPPAEKATSTST